jgi:hypothetical protein
MPKETILRFETDTRKGERAMKYFLSGAALVAALAAATPVFAQSAEDLNRFEMNRLSTGAPPAAPVPAPVAAVPQAYPAPAYPYPYPYPYPAAYPYYANPYYAYPYPYPYYGYGYGYGYYPFGVGFGFRGGFRGGGFHGGGGRHR